MKLEPWVASAPRECPGAGAPWNGSILEQAAVGAAVPQPWDTVGESSGAATPQPPADSWGSRELAESRHKPRAVGSLARFINVAIMQAGFWHFSMVWPPFRQDGLVFHMLHWCSSPIGHRRVDSVPIAEWQKRHLCPEVPTPISLMGSPHCPCSLSSPWPRGMLIRPRDGPAPGRALQKGCRNSIPGQPLGTTTQSPGAVTLRSGKAAAVGPAAALGTSRRAGHQPPRRLGGRGACLPPSGSQACGSQACVFRARGWEESSLSTALVPDLLLCLSC